MELRHAIYLLAISVWLMACQSSTGGQSAGTVHTANWDLSCFNGMQNTCVSYAMATPVLMNCTGLGQAVSVCPAANCTLACTLTDAAGDVIRNSYYGTSFGSASQIQQVCTSNGGQPSVCQ